MFGNNKSINNVTPQGVRIVCAILDRIKELQCNNDLKSVTINWDTSSGEASARPCVHIKYK